MSDLPLVYAGELYDRTWALKDGSVKPEGINLNYLVFRVPTLFRRMVKFQEFPASEMSLAVQVVSTANERESAPFKAIPVFTSRMFRHGFIFVSSSSRMTKPVELEGKRVGLPDYSSTANIWVRGILQHEYGVDLGKVMWVSRVPPKAAVSRALGEHVKLVTSPPGSSLEGLLESGEMDALISPELPAGVNPGGPIRRLLPDYEEREKEYFKRTGIFPIMHTVVLRKDVLERTRWVASSLFKAFEESKSACYRHVAEAEFGALLYTCAWFVRYYEEERAILGPDPFPYGLEKNRKPLETFIDYCFEQHLLDRRPELEELFESSTL